MTDLAALQRHERITDLLRLAHAQGDALRDDRLDEFLGLMVQREQIVADLLAGIDTPPPANVVPFPLFRRGSSPGELRETTRMLIAAVLEQDEHNEALLQAQLGQLRGALSYLNQGSRAARGYIAAQAPNHGSWRLDVAT